MVHSRVALLLDLAAVPLLFGSDADASVSTTAQGGA
jgi:hypothetical protein